MGNNQTEKSLKRKEISTNNLLAEDHLAGKEAADKSNQKLSKLKDA